MPLNVTKELTDAVWTALEGRSAFTSAVLPGNRVKTSEEEWTKRLDSRQDLAAFPCVHVRVTNGDVSTPMRSFGTGEPGHDYAKRKLSTIRVQMAHYLEADDAVMPLEAEIEAALISLDSALRGTTLRPGPIDWRGTRGPETFNGKRRHVATWTATVECRPYVSDLTS